MPFWRVVSLSLCGYKTSAKATGSILFDFSQNLYFWPKWWKKVYFEESKNISLKIGVQGAHYIK